MPTIIPGSIYLPHLPDGARAEAYLREQRERDRDRWRHIRDPRISPLIKRHAAIALVTGQKASGAVTPSGGSVSLPNNAAAGSLIVCCVESFAGTGTPTFATPTMTGATFQATPAVTLTFAVNCSISMYYAYNITGGAKAVTVSATGTGLGNINTHIAEFSGIATAADPTDKSATGSGVNVVTTGATATLSQADELVVAFAVAVSGTGTHWAAGATYILLSIVDSGEDTGDEYKVVAATTAVTGVFAAYTDVNGIIVATFKGAAAVAADTQEWRGCYPVWKRRNENNVGY